MPRVLFYVQHLLGTGHIKRSSLLVQALRASGLEVHLVSGGMPICHNALSKPDIQLPPLRTLDESFRVLVDENGQKIDAAWQQKRTRALLDCFHNLRPDIVIIETFPFGRRKLKFELLPLLDQIKRTPERFIVICSVRDIVQAKSPDRMAETVKWVRAYFDLIMVHADPSLVRFEESFLASAEIEPLIEYTGYVSSPADVRSGHDGNGEILVSAGGGAVGYTLLKTAILAQRQSKLRSSRWRILAGPNLDASLLRELKAVAGPTTVVERNRDDFAVLLQQCTLSVSQFGYNTAMDIIQSGTRALVVPYQGTGETEQMLRARKLEQRGIVTVLAEHQLNAKNLAAAVDRAASKSKSRGIDLSLDGANQSARIVSQAWRQLNNTDLPGDE